MPVPGSLVLCLAHMDAILEVDPRNLTLRAQPGAVTMRIDEAAARHGLFYPPDPGSMRISTIGGNVAENSGGLRGLKYGVTRDYVMDRKLFGRPLSEQQNTQFRMAEMDAEIDLVQVYVDHCVAEHNAGRLTSNMGAKAKMMASEVEWKMLDLGVQLHGGAGFMDEYPISRMFSDARVNRILAGSSEVMRLIIGRDVFSENYKSILD